ncbi:MAG: cofactor-independent phosphoglycerate mutase [Methanomicrobia archaeon]|nr:cofactor-independent phosphoglycerate mutase [Methanomicrobia archaeon]
MKYVLLIGDGMADYPIPERGNKTALQLASTPNLDHIAAAGTCGLVQTIPAGMTAGSDIATLSILGYDPARYHTGRGPLEAMALRIPLEAGDIAFRCNLITERNGILADFSGGHVTTEEARGLIAALNAALRGKWLDEGWEFTFYAGVSYRNIFVLESKPNDFAFQEEKEIGCAPPHDIVGERIEAYLPKEAILRAVMLASKDVLENHEVNVKRAARGEKKANMVWLWSGGEKPQMPSFSALYGVQRGSVISGVDLIKGIGRCAGLDAIDVPGATGYLDTNYTGKAEYALRSLADNDFVLVHVEAPDEAGHLGDIDLKVNAIEEFDELVVGTVLSGLNENYAETEGYRILVMPDHYTPVSVGTHTREPVPFAIYDSLDPQEQKKEGRFDEQSAQKRAEKVLDARSQELMRLFFRLK